MYKATVRYESILKSWGVTTSGEVDFDLVSKALPGVESVWSNLHKPVYGPEYWKDLLINISKMWWDLDSFPHEKIRKISIPVLVLLGDHDDIIPVEHAVEMFRMIPNAKLAIFPNAGHNLPLLQNKEFCESIIGFWNHIYSQKEQ